MLGRAPVISLAIVVGSQNARATIRECLNALIAQTTDDAQIVVVDNSTDGSADLVREHFPNVRLIRANVNLLTPVLWQIGIDATESAWVALTIAGCIPAPDWIVSLRRRMDEPALVGIGGVLDSPENGRAVDWAMYFARYSAFLPPNNTELRMVNDVAGDNAAYRRDAILACADTWRGGFWETLVHDCLRANGGQLALDPAVRVRFGAGYSFGAMARLRFRHGRHYGSTRVGNRTIRIITAPIIPVVLLRRIWRRVRVGRPDWMSHLSRAMPALLTLIGAWSLGEASGYLLPQRSRTIVGK